MFTFSHAGDGGRVGAREGGTQPNEVRFRFEIFTRKAGKAAFRARRTFYISDWENVHEAWLILSDD